MNPQVVMQELLQRQFANKNRKNIRFSLRSFSNHLGMSPGAVSEMLNGRRRISKKMAIRIADRLQIDPLERERILSQFSDPVTHPHKRSESSKEKSRSQLELDADQFKLLGDWYHFGILTLMETSGFINNSKWIAKRLGINSNRARDSLERLSRLGLIEKSGKTFKRIDSMISTSDGIRDLSIQKAHTQYLENAEKALHEVPVELRDFSSIMFAIDPERIPEAKKLIRKFQNQMEKYLERGNRKEVYQMCVLLFPLTQMERKPSS